MAEACGVQPRLLGRERNPVVLEGPRSWVGAAPPTRQGLVRHAVSVARSSDPHETWGTQLTSPDSTLGEGCARVPVPSRQVRRVVADLVGSRWEALHPSHCEALSFSSLAPDAQGRAAAVEIEPSAHRLPGAQMPVSCGARTHVDRSQRMDLLTTTSDSRCRQPIHADAAAEPPVWTVGRKRAADAERTQHL
jgi:hypothetical protein